MNLISSFKLVQVNGRLNVPYVRKSARHCQLITYIIDILECERLKCAEKNDERLNLDTVVALSNSDFFRLFGQTTLTVKCHNGIIYYRNSYIGKFISDFVYAAAQWYSPLSYQNDEIFQSGLQIKNGHYINRGLNKGAIEIFGAGTLKQLKGPNSVLTPAEKRNVQKVGYRNKPLLVYTESLVDKLSNSEASCQVLPFSERLKKAFLSGNTRLLKVLLGSYYEPLSTMDGSSQSIITVMNTTGFYVKLPKVA
jgi:hypothetical protein